MTIRQHVPADGDQHHVPADAKPQTAGLALVPGRLRFFADSARKPLFSVVLTLAAGFLVVMAVSNQPLQAYKQLFLGNFATPAEFGNLLTNTYPVLIIALGIVFAFQAGVYNVGGEGQLYVGAVAGAATGLACHSLPGPILIVLCLVAGIAAGAVLSWIPAGLKVRFGVDEIVTTLLLNYIALQITSYVVANQLRDPTSYGATSRLLPSQSDLPAVPGLPGTSIGILIAVGLVPVSWLVLFRTTWGANLRAAGSNLRFAEAIGVRARREVVRAMLVSGGLAGLAGAVYVLGIEHRFDQSFSPGYGLMALTVALLARLNPLGTLLMSLFYAAMLNGSNAMQITTNVPQSLVNVLTGLLVLLMTVEIRRRRRGSRASSGTADPAGQDPAIQASTPDAVADQETQP
jgi:simple sugar transport system permease protein